MRGNLVLSLTSIFIGVGAGVFSSASALAAPSSVRINEAQALQFIDRNGGTWVTNHSCVSCHSGWSYGMGRIGTAGWQSSLVPKLEAYASKRLADWANIKPWYGSHGDAKGTESLGTESILSASLLSEIDVARGSAASANTYQAVRRMLELQQSDGGIPWLDFHLQPLESTTARVFGSAIARVALSRSKLDTKPEFSSGASRLKSYLAGVSRDQTVYLYYRAMVAWAAAETPGMLSRSEIAPLVQALVAAQNRDGGWSMNHLGNWKKTGTFPWSADAASDANATAVVLLALSRVSSAYSAGGDIPGLKTSVTAAQSWLSSHQNGDGSWSGVSLNIDDEQNHGYMTDFATGLALKAMR